MALQHGGDLLTGWLPGDPHVVAGDAGLDQQAHRLGLVARLAGLLTAADSGEGQWRAVEPGVAGVDVRPGAQEQLDDRRVPAIGGGVQRLLPEFVPGVGEKPRSSMRAMAPAEHEPAASTITARSWPVSQPGKSGCPARMPSAAERSPLTQAPMKRSMSVTSSVAPAARSRAAARSGRRGPPGAARTRRLRRHGVGSGTEGGRYDGQGSMCRSFRQRLGGHAGRLAALEGVQQQ